MGVGSSQKGFWLELKGVLARAKFRGAMLKALKILTTMTDISVMTIDREILRQSISYGHRPLRGSEHGGSDEVCGGDSGLFVAPLTIPPPLYRERRWGIYREGARTHTDTTDCT